MSCRVPGCTGVWVEFVYVYDKIFDRQHGPDGEIRDVAMRKEFVEKRNVMKYLDDADLGYDKLWEIGDKQIAEVRAEPCPNCHPNYVHPDKRQDMDAARDEARKTIDSEDTIVVATRQPVEDQIIISTARQPVKIQDVPAIGSED